MPNGKHRCRDDHFSVGVVTALTAEVTCRGDGEEPCVQALPMNL